MRDEFIMEGVARNTQIYYLQISDYIKYLKASNNKSLELKMNLTRLLVLKNNHILIFLFNKQENLKQHKNVKTFIMYKSSIQKF